jgi:hypothetical protein
VEGGFEIELRVLWIVAPIVAIHPPAEEVVVVAGNDARLASVGVLLDPAARFENFFLQIVRAVLAFGYGDKRPVLMMWVDCVAV